jgi:hypothetical protein
MSDVGVYAFSPGNGGVHHYRIAEPFRVLSDQGVRTATGKILTNEIVAHFDTILVHMLHYEHTLDAWEQLAAGGKTRLVLDVDDAMWAPDWEPFKKNYPPEAIKRLYRVAELAHVITTPSFVIAEHMEQFNRNVWVVPNTVPGYLLFQTPRDNRHPVVGWQGSASHQPDLTDSFMRQMSRFLVSTEPWKWKVWGYDKKALPPHLHEWMETVPWETNIKRYYRSLSMDIGIGPLKGSAFTDAKSSLRAVEYAALGIPAVLSDSPAYRGWVEDGRTGYLVGPDDWYDALRSLALNPELRREMSFNARSKATGWTTETNYMRWVEAWNSV